MKKTPLALLLAVACGPSKADTGADADDDPLVTTDVITDTTVDINTTTEPTSTTQPTTSSGDTGTTDEDLGNPAGPCNPRGNPDCPGTYTCCSDDPATVGGKLPNYFNPTTIDDTFGTPIFSGNNNALSTSGQCVQTGDFPSPFATGCAVPCNPRWDADSRETVCGAASVCCSFTQIDPDKDCILDGGTWRAVTGADIGKDFNGVKETWGPLHTTNQDPDGTSCMTFAGGSGTFNQEALEDCIRQLSVADQRGFCYAPELCPCTEDLCAQKNPGYVNKCP